MQLRLLSVFVMTLAILLTCGSLGIGAGSSKDAPRVEKDTLKSWLGDANLLLFDVRADGDWKGSDKKIKGAVRKDPKDVKAWAAGLPKDKKIVLYCA